MSKRKTELERLKKSCATCVACSLSKTRKKAVFGVGDPQADLMFVGEGPGEDEDKKGKPFVGKAGKLLDKMIQAMGLKRKDVYISNVVKCRPVSRDGRNRAPSEFEANVCSPRFLDREISIIKPRVLVTLGKHATSCVLGEEVSITRVRGKWHNVEGINVMPTFHPAYLLRNPGAKKDAWHDLQEVMDRLGLER